MRPLKISIAAAAAAVITAAVLITDVKSLAYGTNKPHPLTQASICGGDNQCIKLVCYKDRNQVQTAHLVCEPNAVLYVNDIVLAKFNNSCPSGCCTPFNYNRDCLTPLKNHSSQVDFTRRLCNGYSQCSFEVIQVHASFVNCQGKASTVEASDYVLINYKCYMNMTSTTSITAEGSPAELRDGSQSTASESESRLPSSSSAGCVIEYMSLIVSLTTLVVLLGVVAYSRKYVRRLSELSATLSALQGQSSVTPAPALSTTLATSSDYQGIHVQERENVHDLPAIYSRLSAATRLQMTSYSDEKTDGRALPQCRVTQTYENVDLAS